MIYLITKMKRTIACDAKTDKSWTFDSEFRQKSFLGMDLLGEIIASNPSDSYL